MTVRWSFLTFGGGSFPDRRAAARLRGQAQISGFFSQSWAINDKSLRRKFPEFWEEHHFFIEQNQRGFGKWLWKPFLIKTFLGRIDSGDGLLYLDAGCQLNFSTHESKARLRRHLASAELSGSLLTQTFDGEYGLPSLSENAWTRKDLLDNSTLTIEQRQTGQIQSGIVFLTKTEENMCLSSEWLELCLADDYEFLREAVPGSVQHQDFQAHRWEQSALSISAKKRRLSTIPDETFWHPDWATSGREYPIWAMRNRTGIEPISHSHRDLPDRLYGRLQRSPFLRKIRRLIK